MKLPLPARVSWLLVVLVLSVLASLGLTPTAQASHIRAGDIQAKSDTTLPVSQRDPRRIFFKMVLYIDRATSSVKQPTADIFFGDGTKAVVQRAVERQLTPDTEINVFYFEHTYSAPNDYKVSFIGELRNAPTRNIANAGSQTFYISTRIRIAPELNVNSSPVLNAPAFDKAGNNQVWLHNPAASDADGDSLTFELLPSQQVAAGIAGTNDGSNTPRPSDTNGFIYPNLTAPRGVQIPYLANESGLSTFTINSVTGQVVWNAPNTVGLYNFAIVVKEYRRIPNARARLIGEVIRDMQIVVEPTSNLRPTITIPPDLCVVAGTPITQTVTATDPDNNPITLSAFGGIFPPARFTQDTKGPPLASGTFRWTPQCTDVASDPYTVVFKADDVPASGTTLIDEKAWRITVVGPPPQNLGVRGEGNAAILTWDRYTCSNASRILIYRREGPSGFVPGPCETGIPASAGYVQIGEVTAGTDIFRDTRGGLGLERGKNYCYRIYAEFPRPKGGASIASAEACLSLEGRSAVLTNVTVDRTDAANGAITVRWTKPTSQSGFVPPVGYRLFRGVGATPSTATQVRVTNNLDDTTFVDTGLNTLANPYTYRLEFFSNAQAGPNSAVLTETSTASSVRLEGTADVTDPALNRIRLTWTYTVPWNNAVRPTTIYRRDPTPGSQFVQVGTVTGTTTGGTFVDQGTATQPLRKGQVYCYFVETNGTYSSPRLPDQLINLSQERCIVLNAVPCPPVLTLEPTNCDSLAALPTFPAPGQIYTNKLRWTLGNTPPDCSRSIAYYRIFYREAPEGDLVLLDSVTQQSYVDRLDRDRPNRTGQATFAGCYAVQAVDSVGNRSALSNIECKDNCLFFTLPNIFTPNADQRNDTFRPKVASPLRRTRFQAFNRWGVKVYESTQNPFIDWDGSGNAVEGSRGVRVPEGVYYYIAEVEFADFNNTKQSYKGWVEITR